MNKLRVIAVATVLGTFLFQSGNAAARVSAQTDTPTSSGHPQSSATSHASPAEAGGVLFRQNCAFCHGRDAGGGETGPDLTRSRLVSQDVAGDKIAAVIRDGRAEKGMPSFSFPASEVADLVAFIHGQRTKALQHNGSRRGVDVSDLQTGNAQAGEQYFNGAGGCSSCHSATGDLAGIASRYQGLELERQMLYPENAESAVTVTLRSGQVVKGTLAYLDGFTVGLRDATGFYRSWPTESVRYSVSSPADAHVALFPKYTDDDIHNLMAYLQTLR